MFKTIRPEDIADNSFRMIGKDWMLVTACTTTEDEDGTIRTGRVNTMTASWGGVGILWNKPVATIYLRPSRYTKELVDSSEYFSLSVLGEKYKTALNYCGSHSGRDGDKFGPAKLDVEYMNNIPWAWASECFYSFAAKTAGLGLVDWRSGSVEPVHLFLLLFLYRAFRIPL